MQHAGFARAACARVGNFPILVAQEHACSKQRTGSCDRGTRAAGDIGKMRRDSRHPGGSGRRGPARPRRLGFPSRARAPGARPAPRRDWRALPGPRGMPSPRLASGPPTLPIAPGSLTAGASSSCTWGRRGSCTQRPHRHHSRRHSRCDQRESRACQHHWSYFSLGALPALHLAGPSPRSPAPAHAHGEGGPSAHGAAKGPSPLAPRCTHAS
mmetsp:Transcript_93203/g.272811  ORF Transcript_93203/g.272811 Transcript_93203/m.272811 type:complete len:212 (-) Transcript_93203:1068-1703(-)